MTAAWSHSHSARSSTFAAAALTQWMLRIQQRWRGTHLGSKHLRVPDHCPEGASQQFMREDRIWYYRYLLEAVCLAGRSILLLTACKTAGTWWEYKIHFLWLLLGFNFPEGNARLLPAPRTATPLPCPTWASHCCSISAEDKRQNMTEPQERYETGATDKPGWIRKLHWYRLLYPAQNWSETRCYSRLNWSWNTKWLPKRHGLVTGSDRKHYLENVSSGKFFICFPSLCSSSAELLSPSLSLLITGQEIKYGEKESSWIRERTISSVDWEIRTLKMARIPDIHSWTVLTDA